MSVTAASTKYTCGDLTNEITFAGVSYVPLKCKPLFLYPRGKGWSEGRPVTWYFAAASLLSSTFSLATCEYK